MGCKLLSRSHLLLERRFRIKPIGSWLPIDPELVARDLHGLFLIRRAKLIHKVHERLAWHVGTLEKIAHTLEEGRSFVSPHPCIEFEDLLELGSLRPQLCIVAESGPGGLHSDMLHHVLPGVLDNPAFLGSNVKLLHVRLVNLVKGSGTPGIEDLLWQRLALHGRKLLLWSLHHRSLRNE